MLLFGTGPATGTHWFALELRLSSILSSRFILNLRQVNHDLAHGSETSVSLDIQFITQARSGRSLPRSLEPFIQPLHVNIEENEGNTEDIPAMNINTGNNQESLVALEIGSEDVSETHNNARSSGGE